jgi:hypothetical protein
MGSAGGVAGSIGLEYLSSARSLATGYVAGGIVTLLALRALIVLRARREPADPIVGRRAGMNASCGPQGLPPVSFVDTTARQPEPQGLRAPLNSGH